MSTLTEIVRPLAVGIGIFGAAGAIGSAQMTTPPCTSTTAAAPYNTFDPSYNSVNSWQTAWDTGNYDRNHILLGTVGSFAPYRLSMLTTSGDSMTVDLKNGTIIRPDGSTPTSGQRVAVFGYWSNGTFIANRVILRG